MLRFSKIYLFFKRTYTHCLDKGCTRVGAPINIGASSRYFKTLNANSVTAPKRLPQPSAFPLIAQMLARGIPAEHAIPLGRLSN